MSEAASDFLKSALWVPRLLYGPSQGTAHRQWKRIAKKAAKTQSWDEALKGVEFMAIEEVQGDFSCNCARGQLFEGDNLWLDDMFDILWNATADAARTSPDPEAWGKLLEYLTISGLDHFWFALGLCVKGTSIVMWRNPAEKRRVAKICLSKLLFWWPAICPYDQRFSCGQKMRGLFRGWPRWKGGLGDLCNNVGLQGLEKVSPTEAGKMAREWLNRSS